LDRFGIFGTAKEKPKIPERNQGSRFATLGIIQGILNPFAMR
jgi:hypothetical protein